MSCSVAGRSLYIQRLIICCVCVFEGVVVLLRKRFLLFTNSWRSEIFDGSLRHPSLPSWSGALCSLTLVTRLKLWRVSLKANTRSPKIVLVHVYSDLFQGLR
jgi:hypothetical protein